MKTCDVEKWAVSQVPIVLRMPKLIALLQVMVGQVGRLLTQSSRYAEEVSYELAHNSQVCKMRGMLNDRLDAEKRRVDVVDATPGSELLMVYDREQKKPVMMREGVYVLAPPRSYKASREVNFVVRVPKEWRGGEQASRVVALVNRGKLSSMRYRIEYVED